MKQDILDRLHEVLVEILCVTVDVIKKNNLIYYLCEGTLLGAVRHKGFIPWDDDLDICMPREDYDKFIRIAETQLPQGYYIQHGANDKDYWLPFAKIRKENTIFYDRAWNLQVDKSHQQIYIDIFPLDYAYGKDRFQRVRKYFLSRLTSLCYMKICKDKSKCIRYYAFYFVPINLLKLMQRWCMQPTKRTSNKFVNLASAYSAERQTFVIEDFNPPILIQFENNLFFVPNKSIKVLMKIYGNDFMTLPPENKRRTHNPIRLSFNPNDSDIVF